jgi:hypothetical protein
MGKKKKKAKAKAKKKAPVKKTEKQAKVDRKKIGIPEEDANSSTANEDAKVRKTRATRQQMIDEGKGALVSMFSELEALGLDKEAIHSFGQFASIAKQVKVWEKTQKESNQKKSATLFQDIARHCKDIMEIHPQLDPQTLRDIAVDALDVFCKDLKESGPKTEDDDDDEVDTDEVEEEEEDDDDEEEDEDDDDDEDDEDEDDDDFDDLED